MDMMDRKWKVRIENGKNGQKWVGWKRIEIDGLKVKGWMENLKEQGNNDGR